MALIRVSFVVTVVLPDLCESWIQIVYFVERGPEAATTIEFDKAGCRVCHLTYNFTAVAR